MGLAVQMYTIRDFVTDEAGLTTSLQRIAEIGYTAVQLSAVGAMNGDKPQVDAGKARKMLDDNGLKCIATHRSWDDLVNRTQSEIEFHQTLGCNFTAIGGIPGRYAEQGAEGYARFAADAVELVERLKQAGIRFGYHNHAHEFERVSIGPTGPRTLFDILVDEGGQDLMLEVDVYWVQHAGCDPSRVLERCSGRVPVIHLKDKEVVKGDGPVMAPIGEGNLDWASILSACIRSGVEWYAVEQDVCRRDPFDCLSSSFAYLSRMGL